MANRDTTFVKDENLTEDEMNELTPIEFCTMCGDDEATTKNAITMCNKRPVHYFCKECYDRCKTSPFRNNFPFMKPKESYAKCRYCNPNTKIFTLGEMIEKQRMQKQKKRVQKMPTRKDYNDDYDDDYENKYIPPNPRSDRYWEKPTPSSKPYSNSSYSRPYSQPPPPPPPPNPPQPPSSIEEDEEDIRYKDRDILMDTTLSMSEKLKLLRQIETFEKKMKVKLGDDYKPRYRKLSLMYHPDKGGNATIFQIINNVKDYEVVGGRRKRRTKHIKQTKRKMSRKKKRSRKN